MNATLASLAAIFAQLSLLAFGGGNAVLPEMQRQVVEVHGWMDAAAFTSLFALAQAAPGPNLMICALIGWQVAGLPGAALSMLGIVGPASVLTGVTVSVWDRFRAAPWRRAVQAGIVPVTVGLVCASASLIVAQADTDLAPRGDHGERDRARRRHPGFIRSGCSPAARCSGCFGAV